MFKHSPCPNGLNGLLQMGVTNHLVTRMIWDDPPSKGQTSDMFDQVQQVPKLLQTSEASILYAARFNDNDAAHKLIWSL